VHCDIYLCNKNQQNGHFLLWCFNLIIVSLTCFEPLSVHPQADLYMHFYGIFFMHLYKQSVWWQDVLDTTELLIPVQESQYCMHCAWCQMHPVSHSWVDRLNCTGTCLIVALYIMSRNRNICQMLLCIPDSWNHVAQVVDEWYFWVWSIGGMTLRGKTELLGETPVPGPPHITHGLAQVGPSSA
jgi:hypothetical protein